MPLCISTCYFYVCARPSAMLALPVPTAVHGPWMPRQISEFKTLFQRCTSHGPNPALIRIDGLHDLCRVASNNGHRSHVPGDDCTGSNGGSSANGGSWASKTLAFAPSDGRFARLEALRRSRRRTHRIVTLPQIHEPSSIVTGCPQLWSLPSGPAACGYETEKMLTLGPRLQFSPTRTSTTGVSRMTQFLLMKVVGATWTRRP